MEANISTSAPTLMIECVCDVGHETNTCDYI